VFAKKGITRIAKPEVIIPADITALKQLAKLEEAKIWQEGNIKEYYSKLSEIIRRYMENRFEFITLELTTDEILKELRSILSDEQLNKLKILLQRADLAKFAKSKPVDTENIESMVLAKQFITSTKKQRKERTEEELKVQLETAKNVKVTTRDIDKEYEILKIIFELGQDDGGLLGGLLGIGGSPEEAFEKAETQLKIKAANLDCDYVINTVFNQRIAVGAKSVAGGYNQVIEVFAYGTAVKTKKR
jgi:hypothetical protein